ncbi:MAG: AI-2E family transporter [Patescibacteria group bacterium]
MNGFFNRKVTFDISYSAFAKIVVIALLLLFLYLVREIILLMFVAIVIASGIDLWIDFLQKRRIPRWLSAIFIFLFIIGIIFLTIYLLIPPIASQLHQLIQYLPQYFKFISEQVKTSDVMQFESGLEGLQKIFGDLTGKFSDLASNIFGTFSGVINGIISVVVVFVLAFYFVVEEDNFKKFIRSVTPLHHRPYVEDLVDRVQLQVGRWFRGQLFLGLIVGVMVFVGLSLAGVKYALVLALLAAILELVPYVGPILSAVPAVFFGFTQSPVLGLVVIGIYVLVQQLENHLIVPNVMKKVVGLNPLIIILVILVGGKLAGILGAILAVPIATALHVFFLDIFEIRDQKEKEKLKKEVCEVKPHEAGLTEKELKYREELQKEVCQKPNK